MSVGFTGTSDPITNPQRSTLRFVFKNLREQGETWLHHGDCINADAEAHKIWRDELGGQVCLHPPVFPSKRAFCIADMYLEEKPYLERNNDIAGMTSRLVACPKTLTEYTRSGTWYTVRRVREYRCKPICIILPNGNIQEELFGAKPLRP